MSNVMEMRNIRNKPSRSGFDVSENNLLTAKLGEILPFFCKLIIPGDRIDLYPQHFTRTVPLNSAAYASIKESINFFFVPFHLLSNRFDTFLSQMFNNPQHASSLTASQPVSAESPYFTVSSVYNLIQAVRSANAKDELGYSLAPKMVKLLSYLGYQDFSPALNPSAGGLPSGRRLSPFPLLAYQKIYYDFFRYQQWENSSPWCFNIDYAQYGQALNISSLSPAQCVDSMFTLRYANFKKDYFLGVLPSPQYGDSSVIPVANPNSDYIQVVKNNSTPWDSISQGSGIARSDKLLSYYVNNPSVLSIRKAEAIQKLREIQQSGNQDYKEQVEKIFGVTMSQDKSDLCEWLGGYDTTINVSEVINQSLNGDDTADIKGKGVGNGQGNISREFNDFGFVIGIYTATPKLYYDIDAGKIETLMVHSDDYPNPVLDKIGMQSLPMDDVLGEIGQQGISGQTFGYGPRYFPFKTSYDKVLGGFVNTNGQTPFGGWTAPFTQSELLRRLTLPNDSIGTNYLMFKIDPAILNPILSTQVTSGESTPPVNPYADDQLLINISVGAAFVRNLDYDGLPY